MVMKRQELREAQVMHAADVRSKYSWLNLDVPRVNILIDFGRPLAHAPKTRPIFRIAFEIQFLLLNIIQVTSEEHKVFEGSIARLEAIKSYVACGPERVLSSLQTPIVET